MRTGWTYLKRLLRRDGMPVRLATLIALALAGALFEGVGMGFLIPILEHLQSPDDAKFGAAGWSGALRTGFDLVGMPFALPFILGIGLALFFGQLLLTYLRTCLSAHTQNKFVVELRSGVFANLMDFDLASIQRFRIGELVSTLTTETYRAGYALRSMVEMLAALCMLVVYAVASLLISWQLALIAFPLLGAVAVLLRPRQSYQLGIQQSQENDNLQSTAVESLGGIREIKSLGIAGLVCERFRRISLVLSRIDMALWEKGARFTLLYQTILLGVLTSLCYFASRSAGLSLASLLVFLVILQRMAPRASAFIEERHWWLGYAHAVEKVEAMLEDAAKSVAISSGNFVFRRLEEGIEVRGVHFRHVGRVDDTLAGVSFCIPRGKTVAIVGSSGAGKSTLLDLLARFYDPTAGGIYVDGHDLRELDLGSWRRAIGLVSQDSFLFNETIESNIRYGDLEATKETIVEAARQTYAHSFILDLPSAYATTVGDRGVRLSGGQRQRIALARVLLRKPQILILDEATSDLDSESEQYIQEALREIGRTCTVIMVAHRLSTIEHADVIVVLEKGMVVERGTYAELLSRKGQFARFHNLQVKELAAPLGTPLL